MIDKKIDNNMETVVKVVGTLAEKTVVPIYEDLAKPSVIQIGEGLSGFLGMVMLPLKVMGYQAEHWETVFRQSLEKKASKISREKLQPPNLTVAGPIMQALGYTAHEETIREMFTSLLSTAMDKDTAHQAHPAFVEIIKQMNPDEAKIMELLSNEVAQPVVDVLIVRKDGHGQRYFRREESFIPEDAGCIRNDLGPQYLGNLLRLGLIDMPELTHITRLEVYNRLQEWFESVKATYNPQMSDGETLELRKRRVRLSQLGLLFVVACISNKESPHD